MGNRRKSPKPQAGSQSGSPSQPWNPTGARGSQSPCPMEGSLGGQVLCPEAVLSSGSSWPTEASGACWHQHQAQRGARRPTPPNPSPRASLDTGTLLRPPTGGRGHGAPPQLCACHPGQAPPAPRASISSSATNGQQCGAPLLGFPQTRDCAERVRTHR